MREHERRAALITTCVVVVIGVGVAFIVANPIVYIVIAYLFGL